MATRPPLLDRRGRPTTDPLLLLLQSVQATLDQTGQYLRTNLARAVDTLDTLIYEHQTVQLPHTQKTYTLTIPAQTSQTEIIKGIDVAIVVPNDTPAPIITVVSAWANSVRSIST